MGGNINGEWGKNTISVTMATVAERIKCFTKNLNSVHSNSY